MTKGKEKKITKEEWYAEIRRIVALSNTPTKEGALDFIDEQVRQMKAKYAKAQEAAAKKKEEGDKLKEAVYAVLTNELQTIDEITDQIEEDNVTKAKVTSRLVKLVKELRAEKDMVKPEGSRKICAYKLLSIED